MPQGNVQEVRQGNVEGVRETHRTGIGRSAEESAVQLFARECVPKKWRRSVNPTARSMRPMRPMIGHGHRLLEYDSSSRVTVAPFFSPMDEAGYSHSSRILRALALHSKWDDVLLRPAHFEPSASYTRAAHSSNACKQPSDSRDLFYVNNAPGNYT